MSAQIRALLIGMIGPALQAIGVTWDILDHGVFNAGGLEHVTMEHLISGPAHLIMATGFMVSLVCIPIALQVANGQPKSDSKAELDQNTAPESNLNMAEATE